VTEISRASVARVARDTTAERRIRPGLGGWCEQNQPPPANSEARKAPPASESARRPSYCSLRAQLTGAQLTGAQSADDREDAPGSVGRQLAGGGANAGVFWPVVMMMSTGIDGSLFNSTWTRNFFCRNSIVWLSWASRPL
jgi:hypothetical protein